MSNNFHDVFYVRIVTCDKHFCIIITIFPESSPLRQEVMANGSTPKQDSLTSLSAPHSRPPSKHTPTGKRASSSGQSSLPVSGSSPATASPKSGKKAPKGSKSSPASSRRRKDVDANAPKKPSNAFFWFCQAKRGSLEDQFRGEGMAGQHSLTKLLAQKWGETPSEEKQVCGTLW